MKKTFIKIFSFVALLFFSFNTYASETVYPDAIIYYYWNGCSYCVGVDKFLEKNDAYKSLWIEKKEIWYDNTNRDAFLKAGEDLGLSVSSMWVPFVYISTASWNRALIWEKDITNFLKPLIEAKEKEANNEDSKSSSGWQEIESGKVEEWEKTDTELNWEWQNKDSESSSEWQTENSGEVEEWEKIDSELNWDWENKDSETGEEIKTEEKEKTDLDNFVEGDSMENNMKRIIIVFWVFVVLFIIIKAIINFNKKNKNLKEEVKNTEK